MAEDRIDPGDQNCETDLLEQPAHVRPPIDEAERVLTRRMTSARSLETRSGSRQALTAEVERLRSELDVAEAKIANLQAALKSSRDIGPAIGILMCQRGVNAEEAFDVLRAASQNTHRKLRDVAATVVYTGSIDSEHRG